MLPSFVASSSDRGRCRKSFCLGSLHLPRGEQSVFAGENPEQCDLDLSGPVSAKPNGACPNEPTRSVPLDVADDIEPILPRGWLLGNTFCRGFLSGLIGQGAAGKTA